MGQSAKTNRVFIFEPCLGNMTGHWESNCRRFYDELTQRGIKVTIFCQKNPNPDTVKNLNVIPVFSRHVFFDVTSVESFNSEYKSFVDDFANIDKSDFKQGDLLLFPTVLPHSHKAALEWLGSIVKPDGPHAAFIFMIPAGDFSTLRYTDPRYRWKLKSLIFLMRFPMLRKWVIRRMYTWDESPHVCHYQSYMHAHKDKNDKAGYHYLGGCEEYTANFEKIFNIKAQTLPFQAIEQKNITVPERVNDKTISIGYFGHASLEKGAQFLEYVIKKTLAACPNVKFQIHVNPNIYTEEILARFNTPIQNVTCYHGHVEYKKLIEIMHTVDINLLPYAPAKYAGAPSMVFSEAVCASNVLVIPNYTWLSREAKKINTGHVCFNDYNQESVAQAVIKAVKKCKRLKAKTAKAKENFLRVHNVKNYIDMILDSAQS